MYHFGEVRRCCTCGLYNHAGDCACRRTHANGANSSTQYQNLLVKVYRMRLAQQQLQSETEHLRAIQTACCLPIDMCKLVRQLSGHQGLL
jgi:hypothetical protein